MELGDYSTPTGRWVPPNPPSAIIPKVSPVDPTHGDDHIQHSIVQNGDRCKKKYTVLMAFVANALLEKFYRVDILPVVGIGTEYTHRMYSIPDSDDDGGQSSGSPTCRTGQQQNSNYPLCATEYHTIRRRQFQCSCVSRCGLCCLCQQFLMTRDPYHLIHQSVSFFLPGWML